MTVKRLNLSHDNIKPSKYFFSNTENYFMTNISLFREFPYADYLRGIFFNQATSL